MTKQKTTPLTWVVLLIAIGSAAYWWTRDPDIVAIMEDGFSSGLMASVADGTATPEETLQAAKMVQVLVRATPPRGGGEEWEKRTTMMSSTIQDVFDGKEGALTEFSASINCADCHQAHR